MQSVSGYRFLGGAWIAFFVLFHEVTLLLPPCACVDPTCGSCIPFNFIRVPCSIPLFGSYVTHFFSSPLPCCMTLYFSLPSNILVATPLVSVYKVYAMF